MFYLLILSLVVVACQSACTNSHNTSATSMFVIVNKGQFDSRFNFFSILDVLESQMIKYQSRVTDLVINVDI